MESYDVGGVMQVQSRIDQQGDQEEREILLLLN